MIRLLGWRNEGKSYTRLDASLKRWIGVTFYYKNAWWDKDKACWVDESFHILDRVSIYDRRRQLQPVVANELPLSMFTWNEVVFRSFQAGYLKRIDMELYRQLRGPIAKRLYRLLDKRFYHKERWTFDLRELACEHVGLSRGYDAAGLKRKLRPAIRELEAAGYLEPMDPEGRFLRVGRGQWEVCFTRAAARRRRSGRCGAAEQVRTALLKRKVNPVTVRRLIADHSPEYIRKHIEAVDWLRRQENGQTLRDPAGFLVESIRSEYEIPEALGGSSGRRGRRRRSAHDCNQRSDRRERTHEIHDSLHAEIDGYLKTLGPDKRRELEERAIASTDPQLAEAYGRAVSVEAQPLVEVYRRVILERHLAGLRKRKHPGKGPRK